MFVTNDALIAVAHRCARRPVRPDAAAAAAAADRIIIGSIFLIGKLQGRTKEKRRGEHTLKV